MVAIVRLNPLMSLLLGERSAPFDGASLPLVYAGAPGILLRAERRRWRPGERAGDRDRRQTRHRSGHDRHEQHNCWGSEKAYQKHFYASRFIGCDIDNPRYDQLARLFAAAGYYVEHPDQVGDAVKAALAAGAPAIIEIPIDPDEFPTPAAAVRRPD